MRLTKSIEEEEDGGLVTQMNVKMMKMESIFSVYLLSVCRIYAGSH